eukprot:31115-Pelagococcus_subviridis.AAC.5
MGQEKEVHPLRAVKLNPGLIFSTVRHRRPPSRRTRPSRASSRAAQTALRGAWAATGGALSRAASGVRAHFEEARLVLDRRPRVARSRPPRRGASA